MSISVKKFHKLFEKYGFDIYQLWTHVNKCDEFGSEKDILQDNEKLKIGYSGCWYSGEFFQSLLKKDMESLRAIGGDVISNRIYFGELTNNHEDHYFTIICTDEKAHIFNTYGGVTKLITNIIPIDRCNELLSDLNDPENYEELFGIFPDYEDIHGTDITLYEYPLILPSMEDIILFLCDIKDEQRNETDRNWMKSIIKEIEDTEM